MLLALISIAAALAVFAAGLIPGMLAVERYLTPAAERHPDLADGALAALAVVATLNLGLLAAPMIILGIVIRFYAPGPARR